MFTSGTAAALPNGHIQHRWDAAKQARRALETVLGAVERLGEKRTDVVRVKMFIAASRFLSRRSAGLALSPSPGSSSGSQDREDSVAVGNVYRELFGHEAMRPSLATATSRGVTTGTTATIIVVGRNGFVQVDTFVEIEIDPVVDSTRQHPPAYREGLSQTLALDLKRVVT